jgi:hypothetical protein
MTKKKNKPATGVEKLTCSYKIDKANIRFKISVSGGKKKWLKGKRQG